MQKNVTYDRVYVWQAPVRMYHWVNATCVFMLVATGLIIGRPPAFLSAQEASASYWFGWVRFLHFVSAFIMSAAFMVRVYWMFVGNKYARWDAFIPNSLKTFKRQLREDIDALGRRLLWANLLATPLLVGAFGLWFRQRRRQA